MWKIRQTEVEPVEGEPTPTHHALQDVVRRGLDGGYGYQLSESSLEPGPVYVMTVTATNGEEFVVTVEATT
jgi:hypothetical protein